MSTSSHPLKGFAFLLRDGDIPARVRYGRRRPRAARLQTAENLYIDPMPDAVIIRSILAVRAGTAGRRHPLKPLFDAGAPGSEPLA